MNRILLNFDHFDDRKYQRVWFWVDDELIALDRRDIAK